MLALAWRTPRYDAATSGRLGPAWLSAFVDSVWWRGLLRLVGLLALVYLVVLAVFGKDLLINPIFGIFYVWIWVGDGGRLGCSSAGSGGRSARSG